MCVTPAMNEQLQIQFTCEEIQVALKRMAPFKSPSPDGFSAYFFNHIGQL